SSPRVEALFTQVRRRMLPGLIRDKYREAKAAVDRKELADAQTLFGDVQRMIGKAEKFGLKDEAMGDLAVLVDGFLDLARAAAAPPPPKRGAAGAAPPARPPGAPRPGAGATKTAATNPLEIFNASSPGVAPPVAIRQRVPQVPPLLRSLASKRGSYELTIE